LLNQAIYTIIRKDIGGGLCAGATKNKKLNQKGSFINMKIIKWLLLIALITLTGCIDEKEEFTINPDGSGKIVYSTNLKPMDMGSLIGAQSGAAPTVDIKDNLKKLIEHSQGIDTWEDVSYKTLEDGRVAIQATAYFSDINKVLLGKAMNKAKKPDMKFTETAGNITLEFVSNADDSSNENKAVPNMTDAQIDEQVKMTKMGYQQGKIMMQGLVKDVKFERIIHLPGKVTKTSNFTKTDDNTVQIGFDGPKAMKAMDLFMADDAYLKEMIKKGGDPMKDPDEIKLNEMLFGEAAPVSVTVKKDDKALFDYKAESEAAKAKFPAMKAKLYAELDELAKKQPKNEQTEQLDKLLKLQIPEEKADANDAVAEQAPKANNVPATQLIKKAIALEREKKMEEAIEIYLSVAEDPKNKAKDVAKARTYLARSYTKTKEFEKAKEQLERLIEDFSDNRAITLRAKKQLRRVRKMLGEPAVDPADLEALKEKAKNRE